MEIKAKLDTSVLKELRKMEKELGEKYIKRAERDAVNKGKTVLSKEVRNRYNMKKADFDSFIKKKEGSLDIESRALTIGTSTHFSITPKQYSSQKGVAVKKRKKATATITKKNKKKLRHAFIVNPQKINGSNTMLWERKNGAIKPIKSLSAAQMASNKEISKKVLDEMAKTMKNRLEHYAEMEAKKIADN